MALALAAVSCAGFVSPAILSRPAVAVSRGPAGLSMAVKGLGGDSDTRPVEMIHADADAAFKMLDTDGDELRAAFVKFPTLCKAFEVETRSVWPAMDDGKSEADIFAIADKVFAKVDTDNSGDIEVAELKALLLADEWEEALVEKVFAKIDFDESGEIDQDELRAAFVK